MRVCFANVSDRAYDRFRGLKRKTNLYWFFQSPPQDTKSSLRHRPDENRCRSVEGRKV